MVTVKVISRSGQPMEVAYEQLLEIDGVPYRGTSEDVAAVLMEHETKLDVILGLLGQRMEATDGGNR